MFGQRSSRSNGQNYTTVSLIVTYLWCHWQTALYRISDIAHSSRPCGV